MLDFVLLLVLIGCCTGEIQKLVMEVDAQKATFQKEKEKLEEDLLNMELERRTLEEKLEEVKGGSDNLTKSEWEEEKKKLEGELEDERARVKKLADELTWERDRKDAFDKKMGDIENKSESERNRTLEVEKEQMQVKIQELEEMVKNNSESERVKVEELEKAKKQLEDETKKALDALALEKEKFEALSAANDKLLEESKPTQNEGTIIIFFIIVLLNLLTGSRTRLAQRYRGI